MASEGVRILVTEASDLGLGPGIWPVHVEFRGKEYRRNGALRDESGDPRSFQGYAYTADDGQTLHVLND